MARGKVGFLLPLTTLLFIPPLHWAVLMPGAPMHLQAAEEQLQVPDLPVCLLAERQKRDGAGVREFALCSALQVLSGTHFPLSECRDPA